jgi:hypothetical protein
MKAKNFSKGAYVRDTSITGNKLGRPRGVIGVIALVAFLIIRNLRQDKKAGRCPGCSGCPHAKACPHANEIEQKTCPRQ